MYDPSHFNFVVFKLDFVYGSVPSRIATSAASSVHKYNIYKTLIKLCFIKL